MQWKVVSAHLLDLVLPRSLDVALQGYESDWNALSLPAIFSSCSRGEVFRGKCEGS